MATKKRETRISKKTIRKMGENFKRGQKGIIKKKRKK